MTPIQFNATLPAVQALTRPLTAELWLAGSGSAVPDISRLALLDPASSPTNLIGRPPQLAAARESADLFTDALTESQEIGQNLLPKPFQDLLQSSATQLAKLPYTQRSELLANAIGEARDAIEILSPRVDALRARVSMGVDDLLPESRLSLLGQLRSETSRLALEEAKLDLSTAALNGSESSMRFIGAHVAALFAVDGLLSAEKTARGQAEAGDVEGAWRTSLQGAGRFIVDAGLTALDRAAKLTGAGSIGLDVGLKAASDTVMGGLADATFDAINREAHWLSEQGFWPQHRMPRQARPEGSEGSWLGTTSNAVANAGALVSTAADSLGDAALDWASGAAEGVFDFFN